MCGKERWRPFFFIPRETGNQVISTEGKCLNTANSKNYINNAFSNFPMANFDLEKPQ